MCATENPVKTDSIQSQLDTTSRLLSALQTAQQERLGERTPQHLAHISGPSDKEIKIAMELKKGIAVLTKQASVLHFIRIPLVDSLVSVHTTSCSMASFCCMFSINFGSFSMQEAPRLHGLLVCKEFAVYKTVLLFFLHNWLFSVCIREYPVCNG